MDDVGKGPDGKQDDEKIKEYRLLQTKMKWKCCLTKFFCRCCCKENRLEHRVRLAKQLVNQELDVTFLLKRLRVLENTVKEMVTPDQWSQKWAAFSQVKLTERQDQSANQTGEKDIG